MAKTDGNKPHYIPNQGIFKTPRNFFLMKKLLFGFSILIILGSMVWAAPLNFGIQSQFDDAQPFSEGLAAVKVGRRWGYINRAGTIVINPRFDRVSRFSEGLAAVWAGDIFGGKWGYISKSGNYVIQPQFNDAHPFSEGLAAVNIGKWGYINHLGQMIINPQFGNAGDFSGGLAPVWGGGVLGGKWGYLSKP